MGAKVGNTNAKKHGLVDTPTYYSWKSMKARCLSPTATGYARYGGIGIKMHRPWLNFENFFKDMGERPEGKTLDRIDPDGDYEPFNCQWSTPSEQQRNRRTIKPTQSGHQGVYLDRSSPNIPWRAGIFIDGKLHHLGKFNNKDDAAMMRLAAEEQLLK